LNEASIRTEVEIREPDVGAIRDSINAMRIKGVKVLAGFAGPFFSYTLNSMLYVNKGRVRQLAHRGLPAGYSV
jgi:hypothetical protein